MAFCRIDDRPIRAREPIVDPDAIVVQDPTLLHALDLGRAPLVLLNSGTPHPNAITIPASEIARRPPAPGRAAARRAGGGDRRRLDRRARGRDPRARGRVRSRFGRPRARISGRRRGHGGRRARLRAGHARGRDRRAARRRSPIGALAIRTFRPCAREAVRDALAHARRVIVLETAFAVGAGGIVGQNMRLALEAWGSRSAT